MKDTDILKAFIAAAMLDEKKREEETDFRKLAKEVGESLKEAHLGYMDAGFTNEQAFELVLNHIKR